MSVERARVHGAGRRWRFCSLGTRVEVVDTTAVAGPALELLLGGFAPTDAPVDVRFRLRSEGPRIAVRIDDAPVYASTSLDDVLCFLALQLQRRIIAGAVPRWLVHGAALARAGVGLVLVGPSGAGKSTLTRALLGEGWSVLSDEVAGLSLPAERATTQPREGAVAVEGLARPLHIGSAAELDEVPPGGAVMPLKAGPERVWLVQPPARQVAHTGRTVLLRIRYDPRAEGGCERLRASEALEALWACRMNTGVEVLQAAAAVVRRAPCYRLHYRHTREALRLLSDLTDDDGRRARSEPNL